MSKPEKMYLVFGLWCLGCTFVCGMFVRVFRRDRLPLSSGPRWSRQHVTTRWPKSEYPNTDWD